MVQLCENFGNASKVVFTEVHRGVTKIVIVFLIQLAESFNFLESDFCLEK